MRVKKLKSGAWTTSLQGYVESTYQELVKIFGTPTYGPDSQEDKVSCEWILDIDGTICTIYDYKTKGTPYGKYNWHIGGRGKSAELMVKLAMQNKGALIK